MNPIGCLPPVPEYRLHLRTDNADLSALMGYGRQLGLIGDDAFRAFERYQKLVRKNLDYLEETRHS